MSGTRSVSGLELQMHLPNGYSLALHNFIMFLRVLKVINDFYLFEVKYKFLYKKKRNTEKSTN